MQGGSVSGRAEVNGNTDRLIQLISQSGQYETEQDGYSITLKDDAEASQAVHVRETLELKSLAEVLRDGGNSTMREAIGIELAKGSTRNVFTDETSADHTIMSQYGVFATQLVIDVFKMLTNTAVIVVHDDGTYDSESASDDLPVILVRLSIPNLHYQLAGLRVQGAEGTDVIRPSFLPNVPFCFYIEDGRYTDPMTIHTFLAMINL